MIFNKTLPILFSVLALGCSTENNERPESTGAHTLSFTSPTRNEDFKQASFFDCSKTQLTKSVPSYLLQIQTKHNKETVEKTNVIILHGEKVTLSFQPEYLMFPALITHVNVSNLDNEPSYKSKEFGFTLSVIGNEAPTLSIELKGAVFSAQKTVKKEFNLVKTGVDVLVKDINSTNHHDESTYQLKINICPERQKVIYIAFQE